jgi:hypothetical protein
VERSTGQWGVSTNHQLSHHCVAPSPLAAPHVPALTPTVVVSCRLPEGTRNKRVVMCIHIPLVYNVVAPARIPTRLYCPVQHEYTAWHRTTHSPCTVLCTVLHPLSPVYNTMYFTAPHHSTTTSDICAPRTSGPPAE